MMGFANVNPELVSRIQALIAAGAAAGYQISPGSGYRSQEEQAALYYEFTHGNPRGVPAVAPPGKSHHEFGLAVDLQYGNDGAAAWANANAAKFGLHFPVPGENWHVEMMGGDQPGSDTHGFYQGAQQMGAYGFDLTWAANPMSAEQRQDQQLTSYMDAMVGAHRDALLGGQDTAGLSVPMPEEIMTPGMSMGVEDLDENFQPLRQETTTVGGGRRPGGPMAGGPGAGGGSWSGGNVPPPGYVPPGSGVERWRSVAIAALRYTGVEPTPAIVDRLLMQMSSESGGNQMAVNNWDSNAQKGDPSKGLMQNIGSAFPQRAAELANRGIFDGFANIVASIRYSLNTYGSLEKAWRGHGY